MKPSFLEKIQAVLGVTRAEASVAFVLLAGFAAGWILSAVRSQNNSKEEMELLFDSAKSDFLSRSVGVTPEGEGVPVLMLADTLAEGEGTFPASQKKKLPDAPIDLNTASAEEMQQLPGIGPKIAERIIAYRSVRPFRRIEEIVRVKGIGRKTFEKIRPYITVGSLYTLFPESAGTAVKTEASDSVLHTATPIENRSMNKININTATAEELMRLPGIGPALAQRIIEQRPFARIEDILRVKGIGPKKFEKIREMITVEE